KVFHETDTPKPGDVVVWKFGRTFSHGAVYVGDNKIIHIYIGRGVVLDEVDQAELSVRPMKFYTFVARD
ncbi:NlpC/P60 family protein, partial [Neisseria sp. P0003.S003]|uniref:NlpC/P60 family protein n=1 Tax=Neisseria sp. P0003.S003 TaxID=3436658 RepID=UPI003F822B1F